MTMTSEVPKHKRYRKGAKMQHVTEFVITILAGNMFYDGDKLQNPGWGQNWSIKQIDSKIKRGHLLFAIEETNNG